MKYPYVLPILKIHDAGNGKVQVHRGHRWSEPMPASELTGKLYDIDEVEAEVLRRQKAKPEGAA